VGNNLWIQRFRAGEVVAIDPLFEEIFAPFAIVTDCEFRRLDFGDGQAELYYRPGGNSGMFAHFHSELVMFEMLFDFLKRSRGSVAFWPDEKPCGAVGHASDLADMDPDLIETVDPRVVTAPRHLLNLITRGVDD
jgi:hypothetical protein